MRRRDFAIGLLLAAMVRTIRAQQPAKQHRIAIVVSTAPVSSINDPSRRYWRAFWEELRRLGDIEGQTLAVELYSGRAGPPASPISLAKLSAATRM
jgi:hypothetical protein